MSMKSALFALALGLLASGLATRPAIAATPTASFGVSATVQATCAVAASPLVFGGHARSMENGTSALLVTCTHPTLYNIGLTASPTNGISVTPLRMGGSGSALLSYTLVSNPRGIVTSDQMAGRAATFATGPGSGRMLAVNEQTPEGQDVASAAFGDTITVTIIY
jgi:spore coat protein U-like protein